ncbi:MAG: hypothetical protein LBR11_04870 [Deltaproteobacteria bacterium]|jgi:hypothetical protein|nr:hypothetical protein [Deltaproteobacteria bacterium]
MGKTVIHLFVLAIFIWPQSILAAQVNLSCCAHLSRPGSEARTNLNPLTAKSHHAALDSALSEISARVAKPASLKFFPSKTSPLNNNIIADSNHDGRYHAQSPQTQPSPGHHHSESQPDQSQTTASAAEVSVVQPAQLAAGSHSLSHSDQTVQLAGPGHPDLVSSAVGPADLAPDDQAFPATPSPSCGVGQCPGYQTPVTLTFNNLESPPLGSTIFQALTPSLIVNPGPESLYRPPRLF